MNELNEPSEHLIGADQLKRLWDHSDDICNYARHARLLTGGICPDQERWYEGHRALKQSREERANGVSRFGATDVNGEPEPEWLKELTPLLEKYWETGQTPDDLDIEDIDAMIAQVEPKALEERKYLEKNKKKKKNA